MFLNTRFLIKEMLKSLKCTRWSLMQQFQISLLRLFINKRLIHINNAAFDKTVAKLFIILKQVFFSNLKLTNYLNSWLYVTTYRTTFTVLFLHPLPLDTPSFPISWSKGFLWYSRSRSQDFIFNRCCWKYFYVVENLLICNVWL